MSQAMRKITGNIANRAARCLPLNQLRTKIGVT